MKHLFILVVSVALFLSGAYLSGIDAQDVRRMTVEELKSQMTDQNVLILDVRREGDWKNSSSKIKGALRARPSELEAWAGLYPKDKRLVLY
jgi:rhodanese-related sulfurtransferase